MLQIDNICSFFLTCLQHLNSAFQTRLDANPNLRKSISDFIKSAGESSFPAFSLKVITANYWSDQGSNLASDISDGLSIDFAVVRIETSKSRTTPPE